MLIQRTRNLAITLLFSIPILLASANNGLSSDSAHRRDHANLARMIKMRAAPPAGPRAGGGGLVPGTSSLATSSSTPSSSSISSSSPPASSATSVPAQVSTSSPPALTSSSSVPPAPPTSSASVVSSNSPAATTTPGSSLPASSALPPSSTSNNPAPSKQDDAPAPQPTPVKGQSASVDSVTLTSRVPAASASSANDSQIGGSSSLSRTTMTILIVLAASVGGCAIVWTIIRKWKFRPSAGFEDRLEPIDWQPAEHDSGLPMHRRPSNASSFHSAGHDNGSLNRSDSQAGRGLSPLPEHDFTPGPATLAPVGGYADLARGPSPQPQMQEALQRGPSFTRGYENYSNLPPHHQGVHDAYDHSNIGAGY